MVKDDNFDYIISRVLLTGVFISVSLMSLGLIILAFNPGLAQGNILPFREIFRLILEFNPMAFINLGLVFLLLTPLVGVIVIGVGFALKKEWLFTGISIMVLLVLFVSIAVGSS